MPFTIAGDWIPEKEPIKKPSAPIKIVKEKRGNSVVTLILNLPLDEAALKSLCAKCKQQFGCGGSVKEDKIELQGDKIQLLKELLIKNGFKIK